jgi:ribonuclease-3
LRAALVSASGLGRAAETLDIGPWIFLGRGEEQAGGRKRPALLADALEALMGAVFLDGGFSAVNEVVKAWLAPLVPSAEQASDGDPKTRLQQLTQAELREGPRYLVLAESGPGHAKVFEVAVLIAGQERARATGRSKKEAEQAAATAVLAEVEQTGHVATGTAPSGTGKTDRGGGT